MFVGPSYSLHLIFLFKIQTFELTHHVMSTDFDWFTIFCLIIFQMPKIWWYWVYLAPVWWKDLRQSAASGRFRMTDKGRDDHTHCYCVWFERISSSSRVCILYNRQGHSQEFWNNTHSEAQSAEWGREWEGVSPSDRWGFRGPPPGKFENFNVKWWLLTVASNVSLTNFSKL